MEKASSHQPDSLELTILMPCLNEAETIETVVRKALGYLEKSGISGEVLVADNGSTDGSQAMALALGARVISVPIRGYGAALIAGIENAYGRYVIMGDADDSYDFTALDPFVERLRAGDELVMGNRFKGGIKPGAMPPLHRYLGNPVLSAIGQLFFKIPVGDFHCGLRGFSRKSMLALCLNNTGMEFASEMVVKSALNGLRMSEVPTTLSPDGRSRPPHLRTWRDGWRHLRFLLLYSPRWLFLYPGLVLMGLGAIAAAVLAGGPFGIVPNINLDIHTLAVACFSILVGAQLLLFSAIARRFSEVEGFLPPSKRYGGILGMLSLESITPLGALFAIAGMIGFGMAIGNWAAVGFGPIEGTATLRLLLLSLTSFSLGIQTIASAFLASVFAIRHRPVLFEPLEAVPIGGAEPASGLHAQPAQA
jgi:glycosyltransferase involved in cell wall biosynthesis